jgi:adenylylsulfate kinase
MSIQRGFAVWITGLPGSGKSTITRELVALLAAGGVRPVVLESDVLRTVLTPEPTYRDDERNRFYQQLAELGRILVDQGLPVVLDATANRRDYRDHARSRISRFIEVHVKCPLDVCKARDPKGIYAAAGRGEAANVPGVQAAYEEPLNPEVTLDCRDAPAVNANRVFSHLRSFGCI